MPKITHGRSWKDGWAKGYEQGRADGVDACAHGRWDHDTAAHEATERATGAPVGHKGLDFWEVDEAGNPIDLTERHPGLRYGD